MQFSTKKSNKRKKFPDRKKIIDQTNSSNGVYNIPIEDLERYGKLSPREIWRWLTEIHDLILLARKKGPLFTRKKGPLRKSGT